MMDFASVCGFGGAFDLGAVQAGLRMVGRKERISGYGALNILANRQLLGYNWDTDLSEFNNGEDWEALDVDVVLGNPRCSGWSTLSRKDFRGADSKANEDMWALIRYAGRVKPKIVVFESVQQAYTQGRDFMATLRHELETISGLEYNLYHVLHNNYSLGGCSIRRRYFFVASLVPFGIERVDIDRLPVVNDVFQDLEPLESTWEKQPYRSLPSWWSAQMWDGTGTVDGHAVVSTPHLERALELVTGSRAVEWNPGEQLSIVARRYYERHGDLPRSWYYDSSLPVRDPATGEEVRDATTGKVLREPMPKAEALIRTNFNMGFNQLTRWHGTKAARVITGGGCVQVLHPTQLRTITHREAARIQGFPDSWLVRPMRGVPELGSTWGKGIPAHAGKWISTWARNSLLGEPGSYTGDPVESHTGCLADHHDREWIIDVTDDWKRLTAVPDEATVPD